MRAWLSSYCLKAGRLLVATKKKAMKQENEKRAGTAKAYNAACVADKSKAS